MKKIAIAVLIFLCAAPAMAADSGFYAGIKLGSADKSVNTISESSTAVGVFGGYSFNPYIAAEIGYTDLGDMLSGFVTFTTIEVSAVGTLPVNQQFSLFGKLGMAKTEEKAFGLSGSRTAATFGLGGQFNINPMVGIRAGFDRHSFGDGTIFAEGDSDLWSVAGVFRF